MRKNWPIWIGCLVVVALFALYLWPPRETAHPPPVAVESPPAVQIEPPAIRHPIEAVPPEVADPGTDLKLDQPLPVLEQSDARMREVLAALFREQQLDRFFLLEHFIERFVVMIDNLPRPQLPATHRPIKKISGDFQVTGPRDELVLDPANYRRYSPLIALLEQVDRSQVIAVYARFYPLFQQAYEKLGYPDRYFNDRLIEVLDHLLETPQVNDPIRLVRPKVYYQFADPALEELSSGQKTLIRSGPENTARIKALLDAYRRQLTGAVIQG